MKTLIVLMVIVVASEAVSNEALEENWSSFKASHKKQYRSYKEELIRKSLFQKTLLLIETHNERFNQGLETYELGINQFADLTPEEMYEITHDLHLPEIELEQFIESTPNSTEQRIIVPSYLDWRNTGRVTPVKHQRSCGSCWAFSAVGALESHYAIRYGTKLILSEQQLVDCVQRAYGCNGGWMPIAFQHLQYNKGLNHEKDYPYESKEGVCRFDPKKPKVNVKGHVYRIYPGETELKKMVAKGPVAVAFDSSGNFGLYKSGVYYNATCAKNIFGHAVLVIGYGRENGYDYWLVKNSWGADWGLEGYIKMARNRGNNCGIASLPSYPIL